MNKLEITWPAADVISRGTRGNSLNVSPVIRANMSAQHTDTLRVTPQCAPAPSPQSTINSQTIHQLLNCLRSVPSRLLSCVSSFAILHIDRASDNDWRSLLKRTKRFAAKELKRYCWREVEGGVLPSGYEASSIAAEAITEFFQDSEAKALIRTLPSLRKHLRRSVRRIINRLHHRMENEVMVSECDLDPIIHEYGEIIAPLENFPADDPDPAEEAIRNAEAERLQEMKRQFIAFLGEDQLLKDLFACLCDGIDKRSAIARALNISSAEVKNAQRRLDRRLAEFRSDSAPLLAAA